MEASIFHYFSLDYIFQRNMTRAILIISLFILTFFSTSSFVIAYSVRIGVMLPLSGKLQHVGKSQLKALNLWIEQTTQSKGHSAPYIELVVEDSRSDPHYVKEIFDRLVIQNQVVAILGGGSSTVAWELAFLAAKHQVPLLITTASDDRITEQDWKTVFRLCLPASEQLRALGDFLSSKIKPRAVGILRQETRFGQFGTFALRRLFISQHLKVRVIQTYPVGTRCFHYFLARMDRAGLDLLCLVASPQEASIVLEQARAMGLKPRMVFGFGTPYATNGFYSVTWEGSQYLCTLTPWAYCAPYPGALEFKEEFLEAYGSLPTYHAAQAYAGGQVLADAIERAKSLSSKDIVEALESTEMETVYGPVKFISYAKKDRQNRPPSLLVQWVDDRLEIIWPRELATSSFHRWK